jgi:hypothetical protein
MSGQGVEEARLPGRDNAQISARHSPDKEACRLNAQNRTFAKHRANGKDRSQRPFRVPFYLVASGDCLFSLSAPGKQSDSAEAGSE